MDIDGWISGEVPMAGRRYRMVWTNSCSTGEYLQTLESVPKWKFFDTKDTFQGVPWEAVGGADHLLNRSSQIFYMLRN